MGKRIVSVRPALMLFCEVLSCRHSRALAGMASAPGGRSLADRDLGPQI